MGTELLRSNHAGAADWTFILNLPVYLSDPGEQRPWFDLAHAAVIERILRRSLLPRTNELLHIT